MGSSTLGESPTLGELNRSMQRFKLEKHLIIIDHSADHPTT
jgi:hypothetical protein